MVGEGFKTINAARVDVLMVHTHADQQQDKVLYHGVSNDVVRHTVV